MKNRIEIIAEVGSVHDGSFGNARRLVDLVSQIGADAIKFQTHIAEAETLRDAPAPVYFQEEPRFKYFKRTGFSLEQWLQLKEYCIKQSVEFISSPFSSAAVELLEKVGVTRYKVPSGEITNLPMIEQIAQTHKPVILSSGMSKWSELDTAVNACLRYHNQITLLQCTSEYPCLYEQVGLNVMLEMKDRYHLPVGLSDHTLTSYASFVAVALGAVMIEKHLTFSRYMYGSDARHSLEPDEMTDLVRGARAISLMLASPVDKDSQAGRLSGMKSIFEKSVVSLVDIPTGTRIDPDMIGLKKPGTGIPGYKYAQVIGKVALRDIPRDVLINFDDLGE